MSGPQNASDATSLAERVARARHESTMEKRGWMPWDDAPLPYRSDALRQAQENLDAMEAVGLAVIELPPTRVLDESTGGIPADLGREISAPPVDGAGYSVMGVDRPGDSYVELADIGWRSLDHAERDALRLLAVVAELRRLLAERQGGDPR